MALCLLLATRSAAQRRETEARTAEAESYERHGLIESERGNREDALKWVEKSRDTLARLQLTDPRHRERLARLAFNLATLHRGMGTIDRANDMFGEAIEGYTALAKENPTAAGTADDLAQAYVGRADLYMVIGAHEETAGDYGCALDLQRRAITLAPEEPLYVLHLATLYNDRSLVHERRDDLAAMEKDLESCRKAIEEAEALPATKKKVALERTVRHNRAVLRENQGNLYARKGQFDKALVEYAAAEKMAEDLASEEPGRLDYEMIAVKSGVNAGYSCLQQGERDKAKALLAKTLHRLRTMSRRFPRDNEIGFTLANCLCNGTAVSLMSMDDLPVARHAEALRRVEENVDEANRILAGMKRNRKDADQIALLQAANYLGLGMLRYKREEWASALPWFDRGILHCRAVEKSGPGEPGTQGAGDFAPGHAGRHLLPTGAVCGSANGGERSARQGRQSGSVQRGAGGHFGEVREPPRGHRICGESAVGQGEQRCQLRSSG